jgi:hypothetical protein
LARYRSGPIGGATIAPLTRPHIVASCALAAEQKKPVQGFGTRIDRTIFLDSCFAPIKKTYDLAAGNMPMRSKKKPNLPADAENCGLHG